MPRAAQELADAVTDIDAGLWRRQSRNAGRFRQWRALMRTAIEQRKELAIDMEDHDIATLHVDNLVAAGSDICGTRDDVTCHFVILRMIFIGKSVPTFSDHAL